MSLHGLDWAWWKPSQAALRQLDCNFACRYLSHDKSKNLSRNEADLLAEWGVWCVVIWETTANRARGSFSDGRSDALEAHKQAAACGMPGSRPVYFAVDFDANPEQVYDYFRGVVSILGAERIGVYGGYRVVSDLAKNGLATWFWQTYAWSGGGWFGGNHIEQYDNRPKDYDHNRALQDDYGQWMPGKEPTMAISDEDAKKIAYYVWRQDGICDSPTTRQANGNMFWAAKSFFLEMYAKLDDIQGRLATLQPGSQAAADAKAIIDELAERLSGDDGGGATPPSS